MMNRYILTSLLVLITLLAHAQFDKGTLYTSGLGAFSYQKHDKSDIKSSQRSIVSNVAIGVFPANRFMIGVGAGLIADKSKLETSSSNEMVRTENKSSSFTIGPVARYYLFKSFHFEAGYLMGKSKMMEKYAAVEIIDHDIYEVINWTREADAKVRGFSAGIGYSIFLDRAKHLSLDVGVSYQRHTIADLKYSGIAAGFGVSGFIFRAKEN